LAKHSRCRLKKLCVPLMCLITVLPLTAVVMPQAGRSENGSVANRSATIGKKLYREHECAACHSLRGAGCKSGVPLDSVGNRRSRKFLVEHLSDPELHVSRHSKEFNGDPNMMPGQDLDKHEINQIVDYLISTTEKRSADKKVSSSIKRPSGSSKSKRH
jgi:hypothetical protein